jgi:tetratricopeptide (TPR) repeat protein
MTCGWGGRTEVERTVVVAGSPAQLYASSCAGDDYVELVMPADWHADAAARSGLAALSLYADDQSVDIGLIAGSPEIVTATVLRVGDRADHGPAAVDRLANLLGQLAVAIPEIDFGDLLPRSAAEPLAAVVVEPLADAAAAVEAACEIVAESARAVERVSKPGVDGLLARATTHAAKGQAHKASRLADEALRQSSGHIGASLLRDRLRLLGRREKKRLREPHSEQAHLEVGMSWLQLGCDPLAIASFREAVRLAPANYIATLLLGLAYHHEGRLVEARVAYLAAGRLRHLDPTVSELLDALARGELPPLPVEDEVPARRAPVSPVSRGSSLAARPTPLLPDHHVGRLNDRRRGIALLQA